MSVLVGHHLELVDAMVEHFVGAISDVVDLIGADMSAYMMRTLDHDGEALLVNSHNSEAILTLPDIFVQAVDRSDYYASVAAFVALFSDQVSYFSALYAEDRALIEELPEMGILEVDKKILVDHLAGSIMSLESPTMLAQASMRMLAARSLGAAQLTELVHGVSEVVQRMKRVRPIAFDQLIIFFRMVGNSVYRSAESQGLGLLYSYVGPVDGSNRKECSEFLKKKVYTRAQVEFFVNRDGNGMLLNGGHVGCRHWWRAAAALGSGAAAA